MLSNFDIRSNRVKCISFHPTRSWILIGLHAGGIQWWDYLRQIQLAVIEGHEGPIRGIHFHPTKNYFVSGGDDLTVRLWNINTRKCEMIFTGHLDYVRTTFFHPVEPWILSSSDDQTIRVWNMKNKNDFHYITGHNHYVMCAVWHPNPSRNLIASGSLDLTVRIWSYTKPKEGIPTKFVTKWILEKHTRGINWVDFHPTTDAIISSADDSKVILSNYNNYKHYRSGATEYSGHVNNVSCAQFLRSSSNVIISNSEDRSMRVWDQSRVQVPLVFRRSNDRYWIIAQHPTSPYIAAGHDNGVEIFKLWRERPPYHIYGKNIYYYNRGKIKWYDISTKKDVSICQTRRPMCSLFRGDQPTGLCYNTYNPNDHNVLIITGNKIRKVEFFSFVKSGNMESLESTSVSSHYGFSACFISRLRFAVIDNLSQNLMIYNTKSALKKTIPLPVQNVTNCFMAGVGKILLRSGDGVTLLDIQSGKIINHLKTYAKDPVKSVCWSIKRQYCALWSKGCVYITDENLNIKTSVTETIRIKSGAWEPLGPVFVYYTATHMKYLLINGDTGVIRSLGLSPSYLCAVNGSQLFCLKRFSPPDYSNLVDQSLIEYREVDTTEYQFKRALNDKKYGTVMKIMKSNSLLGNSIIGYLQQKGYPEVALHFVQDPKTRFSLALECGNIKVALDCALQLETKDCWHRLGIDALKQGNHQVVELAYQKTQNFERLSFLYLITGNFEKLAKMSQIATIRNDMLGLFHNSLYLGNISDRVKVLRQANHLKLAWMTAKVNNLPELVEEIENELREAKEEIPSEDSIPENTSILSVPEHNTCCDNWPLIKVKKGFFDDIDLKNLPIEETSILEEEEKEADYEEEEKEQEVAKPSIWSQQAKRQDETEDTVWGDGMLDVLDTTEEPTEKLQEVTNSDYFVMPAAGSTARDKWEISPIPADLISAGNYDLALHLLHSTFGISHFEYLKPYFLLISQSVHLYTEMTPNIHQPFMVPLMRSHDLPAVPFSITHLKDWLKLGYKAMSNGNFKESLKHFKKILHVLPLLNSKNKPTEVSEMIDVGREYIIAIQAELERQKSNDPIRQCEFTTLFSRCSLQPKHNFLGLLVAIKISKSIGNNLTTASFCRKALELALSCKLPDTLLKQLNKIRPLLAFCDQNPVNKVQLNIDEKKTLFVDSFSLTALYKGDPSVQCPYCHSLAHKNHIGERCTTCELSDYSESDSKE